MLIRAIVATWALSVVTAAADDAFPWEHDFDTARAISEATGRPIMIDFWATWCGPCKMMNAQTFPDARVIEKSVAVVPLKLDVDREGKQLAKKYQITAMPTILFINAEGEVQDRLVGARGPEMFAEKLDGVSYNELVKAKTVLRKDASNGEANAAAAALYAMRGELEFAESALHKAEEAGYQGPHLARMYINYGDYYRSQKKPDEALDAFRKADSPEHDTALRAYAKLRMMELYLAQDDAKRAERTAKALVRLKDVPEPFVKRANELLGE